VIGIKKKKIVVRRLMRVYWISMLEILILMLWISISWRGRKIRRKYRNRKWSQLNAGNNRNRVKAISRKKELEKTVANYDQIFKAFVYIFEAFCHCFQSLSIL